MKAIGVGLVMRKMGNSQTPTTTFSLEGDEYTMKTVSTLKTSEIKFKLGQEFKETTMDGREAMTTFTLEGDVLTQTQKPTKGDQVTYVRTFTDTELIAVCKCGSVVSTRTYKRN